MFIKRISIFLFLSLALCAQVTTIQPTQVSVDPSGSCTAPQKMQYNFVSGNLWGCTGTWTLVAGGGSTTGWVYNAGTNTLSTSSNVGIGTTSPGSTFQVGNNFTVSGTTGQIGIGANLTSGYFGAAIIGSNLAVIPNISMGRTTTDVLMGIASNGDGLLPGSTAGDFVFRMAGGTKSIMFGSDTNTTYMFLKGGGNVGIGTITPVYGLDVAHSGSSGTMRVFDQTATTGASTLVCQDGAGQSTTACLQVKNNAGTTNFSVTGAGVVTAVGALTTTTGGITSGGNLISTTDIRAGAGSAIYWNARSEMYSGSSGVITMYGSGASAFTRLNFGSTGATGPALTTTIQTNPIISVTDATGGATANFQIPAQKSTTGQRFACIDTNGQIISSVTACVGT